MKKKYRITGSAGRPRVGNVVSYEDVIELEEMESTEKVKCNDCKYCKTTTLKEKFKQWLIAEYNEECIVDSQVKELIEIVNKYNNK